MVEWTFRFLSQSQSRCAFRSVRATAMGGVVMLRLWHEILGAYLLICWACIQPLTCTALGASPRPRPQTMALMVMHFAVFLRGRAAQRQVIPRVLFLAP
jgi:hypothetical protein